MVKLWVRGFKQIISGLGVMFVTSTPAVAEAISSGEFEHSRETTILGRRAGAQTRTGVPADLNRFLSTTDLRILGKVFQAAGAFVDPADNPSEPGFIEFYAFNRRVFADTFYFSHSGVTGAKVGLAPAEVRVPIVIYPVGPVVLGVEGGVRFQAALEANLYPTIVLPYQNTIRGLQFDGSASGAGFIEGAAKLLLVRAGVGGQVDLIDANTTARGDFFFDGRRPVMKISAWAEFLRGRLFAFAEVFTILKFKWKRFWDYTLFEWNGICVSTGEVICKDE